MTNSTLDGSSTPVIIPAGSTEQFNDGDVVSVLGTIDNLGTIFLAGTGTPSPANAVEMLITSPTVTLIGGGTLLLADGFDSQINGSSATLPTLINADNTITGSGAIGSTAPFTIEGGITVYPIGLVNGAGGVIDATGNMGPTQTGPGTFSPPDGIFITAAGALVNDGLLESTGMAGLYIQADTIDQTGGGTILATGSHVGVLIQGNTSFGLDILGGTLEADNGGVIEMSEATLDGSVTPLTITAGNDFMGGIQALLGTIDNDGTIDMTGNSSFGVDNIFLNSPTVTLAGTGEVLDPTFTNVNGSLVTLVNVGNTISGIGEIGIAVIDNSQFGPFLGSAPVAVTNEAAGVINATGTAFNEGGGGYVIGDGLYFYGAGSVLRNDGLMEATGIGGLEVSAVTLDQSHGGTLLASGAGVAVYMQNVALIGGHIESVNGGTVEFNGGTNSLTGAADTVTIDPGGILEITSFISTGTLTLQTGTLDNLGTLIDGSDLILASPTVTLIGGGAVSLTGTLDGSATALLVNTDNRITGTGDISGATLAMTNGAGGVIDGAGIDIGGTLVNAGLLQGVSVGFNRATTIDNTGTGALMGGGGLFNADIIGGTLGGGFFQLGSVYDLAGNAVTLDGRGAAVTIESGTTLEDLFHEFDASFTFDVSAGLSLLGTIDLHGTILGPNPQAVIGGPVNIPNAGLLVGDGEIDGFIANTGTLLAQGGTLRVIGNVDGSGGIVIAPGAAFVLGGSSGETMDFQGAPNERLVLNTPSIFTGTLANLTVGDIIDLGTEDITSAVAINNGSTLAVTLIDNTTLDYALTGLLPGASFTPRSTVNPTATYDFTYVGTGSTNEPGYTAQGSGSFTVRTDGNGTISLADVTQFRFNQLVTTTGTTQFTGPGTDSVTYDLQGLAGFNAVFGAGNTLASLSFTANGFDNTFPSHADGGIFEVTDLSAGGATTDDDFQGGVLTQGSITVTSLGPVLSELQVACFAAGTRIRTTRGDIKVESLTLGDVVTTADGRRAPITWLGYRRIALARHPRPWDVQPIRIAAGAFGGGSPTRPLRLSPDHAVFIDGVLIPVRYLVNGATVVQEDVDSVTYHHVELDRHDVILAEGLPCESYLDTGNRCAFENGGAALLLHPDFAPGCTPEEAMHVWNKKSYAPLVLDGAELEAARSFLLDQAERLGHWLTDDADLHAVVDGQVVRPDIQGLVYRFRLPPAAHSIRLLSRSAIPAHHHADRTDARRLGVAICRLSLDGRGLTLTDPRLGTGWHAAEKDWRWTDGDAALTIAGARLLNIELAMTERYWATPAAGRCCATA